MSCLIDQGKKCRLHLSCSGQHWKALNKEEPFFGGVFFLGTAGYNMERRL